jgi:hypothetical protein
LLSLSLSPKAHVREKGKKEKRKKGKKEKRKKGKKEKRKKRPAANGNGEPSCHVGPS